MSALTSLLLLLAVGCGAPAARFATTDPNVEPPPRRAPGIAVDPAPELPAASARAARTARLAVVSSPRPISAALLTVDRFFRALIAEAPDNLDALLADQAFLDSSAGRQPARGALRSRIMQFDYTALRGVPLYGEEDVEVFRRQDQAALAGARALPSDLEGEQLFVRVHLSVSHSGKTRLLPDQISFFLRPDGAGYRIATIREEPPAP